MHTKEITLCFYFGLTNPLTNKSKKCKKSRLNFFMSHLAPQSATLNGVQNSLRPVAAANTRLQKLASLSQNVDDISAEYAVGLP